MTRAKSILWRVGLWFSVLLVAACGTLPDAGKLADASVQLQSAIVATGSVVAGELRHSGRDTVAKQFTDEWSIPERTCAALVSYAESLAAIVKSGEQGGESVRKVAAAGTQLAQAVGAALPPAAVVGNVVNLAAYLYQQAAIARAAQTLEDSLTTMQSAVDRTSELMGKQLDEALGILRTANVSVNSQLRIAAQAEFNYRERLRSERRGLMGIATLTPANEQRLEQIERLEKIADARYEPTQKQLDATSLRLRQASQLVDAAKQAVADWALAHRQLVIAVREKRTLDPKALTQSIQELRDLVRKVKEST